MKVAGSAVLHAAPDKVWAAINDPAVLAEVIPGCEKLDEVGPGHYRGVVSMGIASIKGSYQGDIRLEDLEEPKSLTLKADGAGAAGTIGTVVEVSLVDNGDGTTQINYDADAVVGGMVGGVGQRVLTSVAKKTAGAFFNQIDAVLTVKKQVGGAAEGPASTPSSGELAPSVGTPATSGALSALAPAAGGNGSFVIGAIFGALSMLIGVLVGSRIGKN